MTTMDMLTMTPFPSLFIARQKFPTRINAISLGKYEIKFSLHVMTMIFSIFCYYPFEIIANSNFYFSAANRTLYLSPLF